MRQPRYIIFPQKKHGGTKKLLTSLHIGGSRSFFRRKSFFNLLETAMGNKGYSTIPSTMFESITFLARALPIRSVPTFIELLTGQCWVTLVLSITSGLKHSAAPLLSRSMRTIGNVSKLDAASSLLSVIAPVFIGKGQVITLVDSWYMKWPYLKSALKRGIHTIGQVRRDTVLYAMPVQHGGKGRPRKYGEKWFKTR